MKQYNDVVTFVRPDLSKPGAVQKINALVVQSVKAADGEHLTIVYLDPSQASPLLAGAAVDKAIQRAFVTPIDVEVPEGHGAKQYGWEEPETKDPDQALQQQLSEANDKLDQAKTIMRTQAEQLSEADKLVTEQGQKIADLEAQLAAKVAPAGTSNPTPVGAMIDAVAALPALPPAPDPTEPTAPSGGTGPEEPSAVDPTANASSAEASSTTSGQTSGPDTSADAASGETSPERSPSTSSTSTESAT